MRGSRVAIWLYAGMIGVPILLFVFLVLNFVSAPYSAIGMRASLALAAMGMIALGAVGMDEVFLHRREGAFGEVPKQLVLPAVMRENTKHIPGKGRIITVRIKRFNSTTKNFETETYRAKADELQTVLGALLDIKAYSDPTLSMRYSCRMGICGSCGMEVNGKPVLACETNLLSSLDTNGEIEVQPMHGHPLLKDLVTDFDSFFEKHKSVGANLYRKDEKEQYEAKRIYKQTSGQTEKFLPYSFCIMCGLCLDACPVVNSNPNFVGPQALSQVYRYNADSRDQGAANRLVGIDSIDGVWGCEFAGSCSKVCPKGVDPASAIQLLKGDAMKGFFEKGDVDEE